MAIDWSSKLAPAWFEHNIPKRFPLPRLSDEDMIQMVTDIEEVRDLMSLRSYYLAADLRQKELDELWVSNSVNAAKASYGTNYGYYYGKNEIARWYVAEHAEKRAAQAKAYAEKNNLSAFEVPAATGAMYHLPMSTSIVRIAKDGKSAKGIWYVIGEQTNITESGDAQGLWMYGKLCADFLKEDGKFKLFHLVIAYDQSYPAGTQYDAPSHIPESEDPMAIEFGNPTIKMNVHDSAYNWADNYPPMPEPYDTLTLEDSYGPEGHPMLKGGFPV